MPPAFVPVFGDTIGDLTLHSEYEEIAAFVSGTIHFGPRFDLTLGGRYSENDQEAKQDGVGLLAGGAEGVSFPTADLVRGRVHVLGCAEVQDQRTRFAVRSRRDGLPARRTERTAARGAAPMCR